MSYPRFINPLVVEDDPQVKEGYVQMFEALGKKYPIAAPRWAFCYQDAIRHLETPWPYHLVILDMRLPEEPNQPASESLDFRQNILMACLQRDRYPVPTM